MFFVEKVKPLSQHTFEARGPGGCLLLIEILTDNISRSHQEIKRLLVKNGSECACCANLLRDLSRPFSLLPVQPPHAHLNICLSLWVTQPQDTFIFINLIN